MTFRTSPAYNGSVTKVMVLENTQKTRLHAPTEKRGFVVSKFLAMVRLYRGRAPSGAGFMGRMGHAVRMAARRFPCFQHPVHPPCLKTWRVGFKSQNGACTMQTQATGNHAHATTTPNAGQFHPTTHEPVKLYITAHNALQRALKGLHTDNYASAVQQAESAIAAMAALALTNGRA